jgi:hypothetical protein
MKRFFSLFLTLFLILSLAPISVFAATPTLTSKIDFPHINDNKFGAGYQWDNLLCTLTLDGINLDTTDQFGIKLPADSTVELKGDNYIKASKYAIYCLGAVTFTGSGTLTLVAETGISCFQTAVRDNVTFRSGNITINATSCGISSEHSPIIFSGAQVTINAGESSIYGRDIKFVSGSATLNAQIISKSNVTISNSNVTVNANKSAISASNVIFTDVTLSVGASSSSLTEVGSYNGENAIKTVGNKKTTSKSFLFGEGVPAFADYLVITAVILGLAAIIAVPIIINRKKTKKLIETSELNKSKKQKNNAK